MLSPSIYQDGFARDNLPPPAQWPVITDGGLPELAYPARFNAAVELLDRAIAQGWGDRPCLRAPGLRLELCRGPGARQSRRRRAGERDGAALGQPGAAARGE